MIPEVDGSLSYKVTPGFELLCVTVAILFHSISFHGISYIFVSALSSRKGPRNENASRQVSLQPVASGSEESMNSFLYLDPQGGGNGTRGFCMGGPLGEPCSATSRVRRCSCRGRRDDCWGLLGCGYLVSVRFVFAGSLAHTPERDRSNFFIPSELRF